MHIAFGTAAQCQLVAVDGAITSNRQAAFVIADFDEQAVNHVLVLPINKYGDDVREHGDQQRNREGYMQIEPNAQTRTVH